MSNKDPIFIAFGDEIVRIEWGHAKSYIQPHLTVISPSYTNEETGAFSPAQTIKLWGISSFQRLIETLQAVVDEYNKAKEENSEC